MQEITKVIEEGVGSFAKVEKIYKEGEKLHILLFGNGRWQTISLPVESKIKVSDAVNV